MMFDGVNDGMKTGAFTLAQPFTVHFAARTVTVPTAIAFAYQGWVGDRAANNFAIVRRYNIDGPPSTPRADVSNIQFMESSAGPMPVGTRGVTGVVVNGASSRIEINSASTSSTTGNSGTLGLDGLSVAFGALADVPSNTEFQEVILFSSAHSQAQAQADNAAMRSAWRF